MSCLVSGISSTFKNHLKTGDFAFHLSTLPYNYGGRTGKVLAETTKLKIMKLVGRERPIKVSIQTKCLKNWH